MPNSFKPNGMQLLVTREDYPENVTASGLILSHHPNTNAPCGRVVAVGTGEWQNGILIPLDFQVGDLVMYKQYAGVEQLTVGGRRCEVVQVRDVLGTFIMEEVQNG